MRFSKGHVYGDILYEWWQELLEPEDRQETDPNSRADRAGRAALRRCATVTEVVLTPAYQRLFKRLQQVGWSGSPKQEDRLAAVAGLLAYVRKNDEQPLAKTMSFRAEGSDKPNVSELRFLRLLESPDLDALFIGLRRVLPLMKHDGKVHANVMALASDLLRWEDDVKKKWAYAYDWPMKSTDA
jgi:CRISPR system Cascade subunit CasB